MREATVSILTTWENFYVIIGSASAALIGLMFVVVTLIASMRTRGLDESFSAFGTPTVVHFCTALLIAATLTAPWQALWNASLLLGLVGIAGAIYVVVIIRRMRRRGSSSYEPVLEDWLWHTVFPLGAYTALVIAAVALPGSPVLPLFIIGAITVLLLFTGIHNSWDTVTYLTANRVQIEKQDKMLEDTPEVR